VNLPETIRQAIDRHNLIPDKTNVVLGVSGGADSVALLHAFQLLEIPCTVAHLNHGLRGEESDADEQFVRDLAENLGLPLARKTVHVQQLAETTNQSIEMAARQARHAFFEEFEDSVIALAHHADDQAETFILKLARGAGPDGLGGMQHAQDMGSIRLIRPMLDIPRTEIIGWLKKNQINWREDASNSDESFLRNRVRHTVLPMLEKELNPNIRETILRTMDILRAENAYVDAASSRVAQDTGSSDATRLEAASTLKQPLALQRRIVRKWLFDNGAAEAGFEAVEKILSLIEEAKGSAIYELNDRQRVVVEYGQPRFETNDSMPLAPEWTISIEPGSGWRKDHGKGAGNLPAEASFDTGKVGDAPIEVRTFKPGDRMAPFGMEGTRKLQDIFTDLKIPKARRHQVPVVVCRGEIIWIPGYRTARGWEVQNADSKSIHVRIERNRTD